MNCLVCDKVLESDHGMVMDGGFCYIEFHYGSRHDQCKGFSRPVLGTKPLDVVLGADEIEAFICDDCFEKKFGSCNAYKVEKKVVRTPVYPVAQNSEQS